MHTTALDQLWGVMKLWPCGQNIWLRDGWMCLYIIRIDNFCLKTWPRQPWKTGNFSRVSLKTWSGQVLIRSGAPEEDISSYNRKIIHKSFHFLRMLNEVLNNKYVTVASLGISPRVVKLLADQNSRVVKRPNLEFFHAYAQNSRGVNWPPWPPSNEDPWK